MTISRLHAPLLVSKTIAVILHLFCLSSHHLHGHLPTLFPTNNTPVLRVCSNLVKVIYIKLCIFDTLNLSRIIFIFKIEDLESVPSGNLHKPLR